MWGVFRDSKKKKSQCDIQTRAATNNYYKY